MGITMNVPEENIREKRVDSLHGLKKRKEE